MVNINQIRERYEKLFPLEGVDEEVLNNIEKVLNVQLPEDFRQISNFYSGGLIGAISLFAFDSFTPNIVNETLRLRHAINLSPNFIVMAEPPASLIVLDTRNTPTVIWCGSTEVDKLATMAFTRNTDTWDRFSEFFLKLIEQEEEEQKV